MTESPTIGEGAAIDDQLLVTPDEAARRLSVGQSTIYELVSSGALESVSIGRCRRVPVSCLAVFVGRLLADARCDEQPGTR